MAVGDLYRARIQYDFLSERMENAFFYEHTFGSGDSTDLAFTLFDVVVDSMVTVQSTGVTHVQIVVFNEDDPTDFATRIGATAGLRTGNFSTPFVSFGFTYFSTDRRLRSGGKRVGGLSESDVTDGEADATVTAALTALALVFFSEIEHVVTGDKWQPRLHTPGNEATLGLPLTVALDSVGYRRVTTQSSRKFAA